MLVLGNLLKINQLDVCRSLFGLLYGYKVPY